MAEYDLILRGGRVVDGSGMPGFVADVGIRDGRIVELGRLHGSASRILDATGLVVAPGFVDHHTHLDAQILWDPYGTYEPQHGVTTVVMGNCSLTLAPVGASPADRDALVKSFIRVEAMPRPVLEQGVPWDWSSYGSYLDRLEGRVGINVGGLVGHIAVRHQVLGEDAVERAAQPAEVEQMAGLVRDALRGGALGLSTNRTGRHTREDGKPVASRLADDAELFALADVLGELNAGVLEISPMNPITPDIMAWYRSIASRTRRPILWQALFHFWNDPTAWKDQLDWLHPIFQEGYQVYGLTSAAPIWSRWTLRNAQVFDSLPTWRTIMFLPLAARLQAFADPDTRARLKAEADDLSVGSFHRRWDLIQIYKVVRPEHEPFRDKSLAEAAQLRGQHVVDTMLDLALEGDLETTFAMMSSGGDPTAMGQILRSPYTVVGLSDAGAHVQFDAQFGYCTTLLGLWVRERQVMSLEEAVRKLTFQVASILGLRDRGLLRPGYAADVTVFDPRTVGSHEQEWVEDYPGKTGRFIQRSTGVHYTIVNGQVVYEDGHLQEGPLAGKVLRGEAYVAQLV